MRRSTVPLPPPEHGNAARIRRRRAKTAAMGLVRLEVLAPMQDKPLLKAAAERLADGDDAFRATLAALVGNAGARGSGFRAPADSRPSPEPPADRGEGQRSERISVRAISSSPATSRGAGRVDSGRGRGSPAPAAGLPPTDAQLERAEGIAERRGLTVPAGLDRAQMSDWISRNR